LAGLILAGLAACAPGPTAVPVSPPPPTTDIPFAAPADVAITRLPGQAVQPTQMIQGPDGWLWIAQLNGPEEAGTGQVIALDPATGETRLLLDGLFKPTGLAVLDGYLWVATRQEIGRAPLAADGAVGPLETVLANLPNNGRSNGTLTVTPQGRLLYETSGRQRGGAVVPGSGSLWELDPADPTRPRLVADGLKGAYAHTFDADGRLWTTEVGDGTFNGQPPPDELNLVVDGANFGWPQCIGRREPARNFGGDEAICQSSRLPVVTFPPHSTPTSVVAAPWAADTLLVALWVNNKVVQVTFQPDGDNAVGSVQSFLSGMQHPQHLLAWPDGSVLVSEFDTGAIYRLAPP